MNETIIDMQIQMGRIDFIVRQNSALLRDKDTQTIKNLIRSVEKAQALWNKIYQDATLAEEARLQRKEDEDDYRSERIRGIHGG